MVDSSYEDDGDDAPGGHRLAIVVAVAALLAALLAGVLLIGSCEDEAPGVVDAASGCRVHPLKYTVTDDPEIFAEQKRFEQNSNVLPKPAFYDRDIDLVAARHAASHEYVVIFYGAGLSDEGRAGLQALERRAVVTKAPVIVAPHDEGDDAVVALSRGYQLACPDGGATQAAEVARFAAQQYASVADPADPKGTSGPAPDVPHAAPSPVDPAP